MVELGVKVAPEAEIEPATTTFAPKSSAARVRFIEVARAVIVSEYCPIEVILFAL